MLSKQRVYLRVYTLFTFGMAVVSVRVDDKVKRKLEAAGVDVASEVRRHLEELAWKEELKERLARLDKTLKDMPPARKGFAAKSVREDRESH